MIGQILVRVGCGIAGAALVAAGAYITKRTIETAIDEAYEDGKASGQSLERASSLAALDKARDDARTERRRAEQDALEFGRAQGEREARWEYQAKLATELDEAWKRRETAVKAAYDAGILCGRRQAAQEMQAELQALKEQVEAFRATAEEVLVAVAITSYVAGCADGYAEGVRAGKAEAISGVGLLKAPPAGAKQLTVN